MLCILLVRQLELDELLHDVNIYLKLDFFVAEAKSAAAVHAKALFEFFHYMHIIVKQKPVLKYFVNHLAIS